MKKTLVAVSVLGAFAGSALAADVQLYGILDTGGGLATATSIWTLPVSMMLTRLK